ncbi:MAG: hypothetical protein RI897_504 [Verrucomicrobiota bacterium]
MTAGGPASRNSSRFESGEAPEKQRNPRVAPKSRWWVRLGLLVMGGYLAVVVGMGLLQRRLIYFPPGYPESDLAEWAVDGGLTEWRDESQQRIGWFRASPERPARMQVLVLHGNGGVAPGAAVYADVLGRCEDVDVYLLEYPGYGGRGGSPSESSLYQAAEAGLGLMRSDLRTFLVGESLGTGVAAYLAGRFPERVEGIVLLAPYTSVVDVGQARYPFLPVRWVLRDRFDSREHLASYRGRVAVVVVLDDTIVPRHFGRSLYEGYAGPKRLWEVPAGGHGAVQDLPLSTWQEILGFWEGAGTE